jgi:hypothetical protein
VLAFGGKIACAGGTAVDYDCAVKTTSSEFLACVGAAGPSGCPYCIGRSCFHPGLCNAFPDCHRGAACVAGLCIAAAPQCPTVVKIDAVASGTYAAGKELCVQGTVTRVQQGFDGMTEIRLGTTPFLFVDVAPMYRNAGVMIPSVGQTVTVHGTVRWDDSHDDYELLPVDWIGP